MDRMTLKTVGKWCRMLAVCVVVAGCSGEPAPAVAADNTAAENVLADNKAEDQAAVPETAAPAANTTCADASPPPLSELMGHYVVKSADRYRGGLTTPETAQGRVGNTVVVADEIFRQEAKEIQSPDYDLVCHDVPHTEGEVPTNEQRMLTTFHGMRSDRSVVWELVVLDPGTGDREAAFEVLADAGAVELWYLYDGWRMVLRPTADAASQ